MNRSTKQILLIAVFSVVLLLLIFYNSTASSDHHNTNVSPVVAVVVSSAPLLVRRNAIATVAEATDQSRVFLPTAGSNPAPTPAPEKLCLTSPLSAAADRGLRNQKLNDVRSVVVLGAKAVSFVDELFPDTDALCSAPPGFVACTPFKKNSNNNSSFKSSNVSFSQRRVIMKSGTLQAPLSVATSTGTKSALMHSERNAQNGNSTFAASSLQDFPTVADLLSQRAATSGRCVSAGCCCSWTPSAKSCVSGLFNKNNTRMLHRLAFAHFASTPTARFVPSIELAAKACPVFDRGTWSLPDNFIDLSFDDAAAAAVRAQRSSPQLVDNDEFQFMKEQEKMYRKNVGPLLVWKMARKLRSLKSVRVPRGDPTSDSYSSSSSSSSSSFVLAPGMLVISGDSIVRQIFARLVHSIRSRECSDSNEMFRGGVFERYFHVSAGYVVTTKGDALLLGEEGCDKLAAAPAVFPLPDDQNTVSSDPSSSSSSQPGRVLLRICYVWDNTASASKEENGTEHVLDRIAEYPPPPGYSSAAAAVRAAVAATTTNSNDRGKSSTSGAHDKQHQIAAIVYWPTMHHCNYAGGHCGNANTSNGAVMRVFASALRYSVPRMVTATSIERHWYPFYETSVIHERNEQLRNFFPFNMWSSVAPHLDKSILEWWRMRRNLKRQLQDDARAFSSSRNAACPEPVEMHRTYRALGRESTPGTRLRLYDFAVRHADLEPRQCDNGHSMCMFWPLRLGPRHRERVNGLSGVCPNGSRCEDPWNFLFVHELLALLFA